MAIQTITMYKRICLRCGKEFVSKLKNPKRCGKCKSPAWNKPRKITTQV